jgi:ribosomal protein L3 glutamine methyltransferase
MKHPSVSANHCTNPVSGLSTPRKNAGCKISTDSAVRPCTLGGWLARAEQLYAQHKVALGQVATSAHDEALYLLLHTLGLPLDSDAAVLARRLDASEQTAVEKTLHRRLVDRVPAAYLTREAFLGGHRFYVDERVIIPRSYFLEIIPQLDCLLKKSTVVTLAADVCTGSGCLAILLAHRFPAARIDAIDLSADALAVAEINVHEHGLADRVTLHRSNVFTRVPPTRYEVIVSNPPYEPSALMKTLSPEFRKEPRLALDGGEDGLDVIRTLIAQARDRLTNDGMLLIEVGGLRNAMETAFGQLKLRWLPTQDGTNCVCLIEASSLQSASLSS